LARRITTQSTILDNGCRVVSETMPHVRSISLGVWVNAGSLTEQPHNCGISHFLEHMVFKGTTHRSAREIALSLEQVGGNLNAQTGKESTLYTAHALDHHLPLAIDVVGDLLQNASLLENDIQLEKQVVLAELSHAHEDPEELLIDQLYANLFPEHPLGYQILGSRKSVSAFSRSDLCDYRNRYYTCDQAIFAAAGRLDHQFFVDEVSKTTAAWKRSPEKQTHPPLLAKVAPSHTRTEPSAQQTHIALGAHTVSIGDDRRYAAALLDVMIGGGMSSRLFQNIREKYGFAYTVYSFYDPMADGGVFALYMACAPRYEEKSVELLFHEIGEVRQGNFTAEELAQTKSQIKGSILLSLESSYRRMRRLGEQAFFDMPQQSVQEVIRQIEQIKKEDLVSLAQTFYDRSQFSVNLIMPKKLKKK